jgi:hypothetical protein
MGGFASVVVVGSDLLTVPGWWWWWWQHTQANSNSRLEKAGYLTKQGAIVKNWKRRWFVLRDTSLNYYRSKEDPESAGVIELANCTVNQESKKTGKRYAFEIITNGRYASITCCIALINHIPTDSIVVWCDAVWCDVVWFCATATTTSLPMIRSKWKTGCV